MSLQSTAGNLLQRAVELDGKKRYTEALICYQEGLQVLVDVLKEQDGEKRVYLRAKVEEYMKRAEQIKELIEKLKREVDFWIRMLIILELRILTYVPTINVKILFDSLNWW
uniref:MIT domain-containing protein n=1 Tax=Photinus pyralis TaxID=7054 RepID=A0A1Y1LMC0_PHOPY